MNDETLDRRWYLLWALPASLILHALAAALMIYGQPLPPQNSLEQQAINVALVPPPDQPKPKPALPPPTEAPKAETPSEPKPQPPPEPAAEMPPPPPEEKPLPKPAQIEILKPVFRYGDKDSGPRESLDGGSAQDSSPAPTKDSDSKPNPAEKEAETKPALSAGPAEPAAPAEDTETRETAARDTERAQEAKQEAALEQAALEPTQQEAEPGDAGKEPVVAPEPLAATGGEGDIELPASAMAPTLRPEAPPTPGRTKYAKAEGGNVKVASAAGASAPASKGYSGLPGVRKLNSRRASGNALAITSMDDMPRDQRAARLCASELQQQLQAASYYPDLVPLVLLKAGNVIDAPDVAFRTRTKWYGLSFQCGVDAEVTRVVSFTFRVGNTIPPEQWARLGLPIR